MSMSHSTDAGRASAATSHTAHIHTLGAYYSRQGATPTLTECEICPDSSKLWITLTDVEISAWASRFPPQSGTTMPFGDGAKIHFPELEYRVESGASHQSRIYEVALTASGLRQLARSDKACIHMMGIEETERYRGQGCKRSTTMRRSNRRGRLSQQPNDRTTPRSHSRHMYIQPRCSYDRASYSAVSY